MNYVRELRSLVGHRPLIIFGAAVLIFNNKNQLLLHHRQDNGQWGLIGGSMEIGESIEETAKREALEESGLTLEKLEWFDLFSGKELIYELPHGDVVVNVTAVYTCSKYRGQLTPNDTEAYELCFFNLDGLPENISPPDKPIIEQLLYRSTSNQL